MRCEAENPDAAYTTVDWRDGPEEVLAAVDALVQPYGLEVVLVEQQSDSVTFRVEHGALSNWGAPQPQTTAKPRLNADDVRALAKLTDQWQTSPEMGVSHHALRRLIKYSMAECTRGSLRTTGPHYGYRLKRRVS